MRAVFAPKRSDKSDTLLALGRQATSTMQVNA